MREHENPGELLELAWLFRCFRGYGGGLFDASDQIGTRGSGVLSPIPFDELHRVLNGKADDAFGLVDPAWMLESIGLGGTKFAQGFGTSRSTVLAERGRLGITLHGPDKSGDD